MMIGLRVAIPKIMLQKKYGDAQLGIYSSIASPTLVVQVFAFVAFQPFLPNFLKLYFERKRKEFRKLLHKLYLVFVIRIGGITLGVILFGKIGEEVCIIIKKKDFILA